ncbi:MAG: acyl-CoA dehydrogenase C-terminal domain-containing protein [Sphingomonadaceae bacterium]
MGNGDPEFARAKLLTAKYFAERMLPEAGTYRRRVEAGADTLMAMPVEAF